jgi:hypothetical protein
MNAQAEEDCGLRIYETGLYLGWGSALLEYTQGREAPSPFDRVIVEQLQGAHNLVERAALACEPAIPAWQGWKQKQSYLLNQIENLQKTYDHKFKRQSVYRSINNTYYSWGAELSIMVFDGRTVLTTTCSTCYFRLGFSTAYAAQAFRQGDEALRNNNETEAKRQLQMASSYLHRALLVLGDYDDVQKPRGSVIIRCSDFSGLDLKNRITALIRDSYNVNNAANCILQANLISDDIKRALDNSIESNNNSYDYCQSKYCPECDHQIVLLQTAVNKDCQKCLDENKEAIAKCMKNGSSTNPSLMNPSPYPMSEPNPVASGTKCPLNNVLASRLVLENNNNPHHKTRLICTYSSNGLLNYQGPEANGSKHGEFITYKFLRNVHYISRITNYNQGKKDGVWKTYHSPNSSGKVLLASLIEYKNDVKLLEEFYSSNDFLVKRTHYVNAKKSDVTNFYDTGKASSCSTYNSDGTRLTYKGWYRDGSVKF